MLIVNLYMSDYLCNTDLAILDFGQAINNAQQQLFFVLVTEVYIMNSCMYLAHWQIIKVKVDKQ